MAAIRTFIAVALTNELRAWIAREAEALKGRTQGIRWSSVDHLHLTLRFLGDVEEGRMPEVIAVVAGAAAMTRPFEIRPGRFGTFPEAGRPRVLWLGVEGDLETLKGLRERVEEGLFRRGFPGEDRPFSPHLTLGRAVRDRRVILPPLALPGPSGPAMSVHEVLVMKSELRPAGPIHTPLARARFREV
jgi:2'-5' RNA ligase